MKCKCSPLAGSHCNYPNCQYGMQNIAAPQDVKGEKSDGSTASYYQLPAGTRELQHLISHRNMNAQIGEIFRACYRYGQASHSDQLRDAKKIKFYAEAEIERLEKLDQGTPAVVRVGGDLVSKERFYKAFEGFRPCKHSVPGYKICPVCEKEKLQDATRQLKPGFSDGELKQAPDRNSYCPGCGVSYGHKHIPTCPQLMKGPRHE